MPDGGVRRARSCSASPLGSDSVAPHPACDDLPAPEVADEQLLVRVQAYPVNPVPAGPGRPSAPGVAVEHVQGKLGITAP
jgi:hypothetical protein